jgi:hypothetical protein
LRKSPPTFPTNFSPSQGVTFTRPTALKGPGLRGQIPPRPPLSPAEQRRPPAGVELSRSSAWP